MALQFYDNAYLRRLGQHRAENTAESLGITTVSTTKAHGRNRDKAQVWGEILSSKGLLAMAHIQNFEHKKPTIVWVGRLPDCGFFSLREYFFFEI